MESSVFIGTFRACDVPDLRLYGTQLWCIECAWEKLLAADHHAMDRCSRCRRYVARVYQRDLCFECVVATAEEREEVQAFGETERFVRSALVLRVRDFGGSWR